MESREAGVNFHTLRVDVVDVTSTESSRQENKEKEKEKEKEKKGTYELARLSACQISWVFQTNHPSIEPLITIQSWPYAYRRHQLD